MKTKDENGNGLDALIKEIKRPKMKAVPKLGISPKNIVKARVAHKLGATIAQIAKALKVSYPTAWKAVKGVKPYDRIKV